jgi:copper chaperone CopZ
MHTTVIALLDVEGGDDEADVVNVIHDLPGIARVDVALDTGVVSVEHSPLVSGDDICQALEAAGFAVRQ